MSSQNQEHMRQAASFSRGMLSAVAAIILFSIIIVGCKKNNELIEDKDSLSVKIAFSKEFNSLLNTLASVKKDIQQHSNKTDNEYSEADLSLDISLINDEESFNQILIRLGHPNPKFHTSQLAIISNYIENIFDENPSLSHYNKETIVEIFTKAYYIRKEESKKLFKRSDICSHNYADGMSDCEDDLGYNLLFAGMGGASQEVVLLLPQQYL